jgi:apolipoprotein N-acyltransferase
LRQALIDWQLQKSGIYPKLLALFILGAILAAATELPFGGWIQVPLLSLIWWQLHKLNQQPLKNYFVAGMSFGFGYFVLGLWWIYISLHVIGGMHWMLSTAAVFLLAGGMALFFSLASLSMRFFKHSPISGLLLAANWVLIEWLRGWLFTGFPWMGLAESQVNGPFGAIAPYLGGLACTFLAVWSSWQLYTLRKNPKINGISLACTLLLMPALSLWHFTKPAGEPLSVELIQGNFAQSLIFNPEGISKQIQFYDQAMKSSHADLIISPETAFPWPETSLPAGLLDSLQAFSNQSQSALLFGVIGRHQNPSDNREFSNRAIGISPGVPAYRYDKSHLVPFGEFIPPGFHWFVKAFSVPLSDFSRGATDQSFLKIKRAEQDPIYAAITICYEDVFGSEIAARLRDSDNSANLMINITNLAWFGASQAPAQQLRLSQLRSLETGLPALRATNTGITAVLGPDGKVISRLPEFTQGTLQATVQAYSGKTPYVIWGNAPILSISCLLLLLSLIRQKQF